MGRKWFHLTFWPWLDSNSHWCRLTSSFASDLEEVNLACENEKLDMEPAEPSMYKKEGKKQLKRLD